MISHTIESILVLSYVVGGRRCIASLQVGVDAPHRPSTRRPSRASSVRRTRRRRADASSCARMHSREGDAVGLRDRRLDLGVLHCGSVPRSPHERLTRVLASRTRHRLLLLVARSPGMTSPPRPPAGCRRLVVARALRNAGGSDTGPELLRVASRDCGRAREGRELVCARARNLRRHREVLGVVDHQVAHAVAYCIRGWARWRVMPASTSWTPPSLTTSLRVGASVTESFHSRPHAADCSSPASSCWRITSRISSTPPWRRTAAHSAFESPERIDCSAMHACSWSTGFDEYIRIASRSAGGAHGVVAARRRRWRRGRCAPAARARGAGALQRVELRLVRRSSFSVSYSSSAS